jgi:hypothetical protein
MGKYVKLNEGRNGERYINGFKVLDMIGKGAYGQVFVVQRGENSYAMKEIPLSHFDVTPEQFNEYFKRAG